MMGLLGGIIGASCGTLVVVVVAASRTWTPVLDRWIPLAAPIAGAYHRARVRGVSLTACRRTRARGSAPNGDLTAVRVLVVEDEKRLAAGLRTGLEAEGFAVDIALEAPMACGWLARTPTTRSCSTSCCRV